MKHPITISIDKEVIKQTKILMASLEINNQSQLIENLLKTWILENTKYEE
jgi:hypothetical protein